MSSPESTSWKHMTSGTKATIFVGLGVAAAVVIWLNFLS